PFGRARLILEALSDFSSCPAIERYYSEPLLSDLASLRIATEISDLFSIRRPARRTIRAVVVDELAQPALLVEFPLDRCNLAPDFHHSKVVAIAVSHQPIECFSKVVHFLLKIIHRAART